MSTITKACQRCKQEKSLIQFYVRSGIHEPTEPGHYTSECKDCMRERTKTSAHLPKTMPRVQSEIIAIEYLQKAGYPALPGKAVYAADVDVVVWGHVRIEVKYARLERDRGAMKFNFSTTVRQQQRGFLGDLVLLICEYPNKRTFHLFRANHPVFYMDDGNVTRVKSGFTFTPGAERALKHGNNRTVMIQPMMDEAQDYFELIHEVMHEISEHLKTA